MKINLYSLLKGVFILETFNKWYKVAIGFMELFLAIPILGGAFIIANAYLPLTIMFVLHLIGLILSFMTKQTKSGHVIGMFANMIAIIPIVGMFAHAITGIILCIQGFNQKQTNP